MIGRNISRAALGWLLRWGCSKSGRDQSVFVGTVYRCHSDEARRDLSASVNSSLTIFFFCYECFSCASIHMVSLFLPWKKYDKVIFQSLPCLPVVNNLSCSMEACMTGEVI